MDDQFPGSLLGGDDIEGGGHSLDVNDGLVGLVGPRHRQLQVLTGQQFGRDILEL